MNEFDLPQEEAERILKDEILPGVLGSISPEAAKEAFILGGQPGSGKSSLVREILKTRKNMVFINGDDLRSYHPNYYSYLMQNDKEAADRTQPVCNFWVEELIKKCAARGLNMIIEGTMRTKEAPLRTARFLKVSAYSVGLVAVSTPYELSLLSLEYRYNEIKKLGKFARYTKKSSHDEAYDNVETTLRELSGDKLFSKLYVYLRTAKGFRENIFTPEEREKMLEVFSEGRARPLEDEEKNPARIINGEIGKRSFPIK